jgi:hypothetical protein
MKNVVKKFGGPTHPSPWGGVIFLVRGEKRKVVNIPQLFFPISTDILYCIHTQ